jgi:hypothetical protein
MGKMTIRRVTIREFLLEALRDAQDALGRNSIDEINVFLERCRIFGRANWPPEVAEFVDKFKRTRNNGRMRSKQAHVKRFLSDPDRIAADYATALIEQMRPDGRGPYKIVTSDGSKSTVTAEAVRRAVAYVNHDYNPLFGFGGRKADPAQVAELVRRGRGRPQLKW